MSMYTLLAALSDAEIDYVLIGGLAVTLHGYQRLTMDVDVVLSMNDDNLEKFVDCATNARLKPVLPIPVASIDDPIRMKTDTGRSKDADNARARTADLPGGRCLSRACRPRAAA